MQRLEYFTEIVTVNSYEPDASKWDDKRCEYQNTCWYEIVTNMFSSLPLEIIATSERTNENRPSKNYDVYSELDPYSCKSRVPDFPSCISK